MEMFIIQTKNLYKNQVDPVDLRNSPDYTLVYGTFVGKDDCELVIEYDDNRRKIELGIYNKK